MSRLTLLHLRRQADLTLTASLYASQLYSNLFLLQSAVVAASTRVLIQNALQRYNNGNNTNENWNRSNSDLGAGLSGGAQSASLLQAQIVSKNDTGSGGPYGLVNVTGTFSDPIVLPGYLHSDGTPVYLGDIEDDGIGFPRNLYPNLTFTSTPVNSTFNMSTAYFEGRQLYENTTLFLGPWLLNNSFALASITVPINNNTAVADTLGWLTVVINCQPIFRHCRRLWRFGKDWSNPDFWSNDFKQQVTGLVGGSW